MAAKKTAVRKSKKGNTLQGFLESLIEQSKEANPNSLNWNINKRFVRMLRTVADNYGYNVTLRNDPDNPILYVEGQAIIRLLRYAEADADTVKERIADANERASSSVYKFNPTPFDVAIIDAIKGGKELDLDDLNKLTEQLGATFTRKGTRTPANNDEAADVLEQLFS